MIDKRLLQEMPEAKQYIWKTVCMQWIALLCNIGFVFIIAYTFVAAVNQSLERFMLGYVVAASLCLIVVRSLVTQRCSSYIHQASCHVKDHLRMQLYQKLLSMKNSYHHHIATSELVQLSVEGIDQLETYFGRYLPQFFYSMIAPITLFIILLWLDIRSALVLLICVPLIPVSIVGVQKFAKKLLAKYWSSYATLGDSFLENLQGLTTLKIYQADAYKHQKMNEEAENFRTITMKVLAMQLNSVSVMDIIAYGGAAAGSIVAIYGYMNGSVSLFAVICIVLLSSEFFIPLRLLGSYFHIAMNGIAAGSKIFRFLDLHVPATSKKQLSESPIHIQLNHVTFSYDKKRTVLNDISMDLKAHQFISIVGESGSGKSTIAKLLAGIADSYHGSITLQGIERSQLADDSFYEHVVYITHKPMIFKGSVRDNIRMAKPDASDEDIWNVLDKTQLSAFLKEQQGLDTQLLEGGHNFSGGQNQRLALARALLGNRDIYIFDEATSNIDVESEDAIHNVIMEMATKKTIIMISHRLANVVHSDRIYVMDKGQCVQQGTHMDLIQQQGIYETMYKTQQELEQGTGGTLAYA